MNKDTKIIEYLSKFKNIKLFESSRARIKDDLLAYARFHSVRVGGEGRSIDQVPQRTSLFTIFKKQKSMIAAIITIALIAGGGTSYAAEGSVPGDALYVVKTEINENIKSAFAVSNEAEARLQARFAEERLEEAEKLAARGELTTDVSADISTRLKKHYEEAETRSKNAEAKGDYRSSAVVRASIEGSFRTYADVLTDLNTRVSGNNGSTLITNIRTYADAAAKAQATATVDVSVDVKAEIESTIQRADNLIADAGTQVARAKSKLSVSAYARVEARFNEAVKAQAEAKASLRAEAYQSAYTSVQAAIRITHEVSAMVNSMLRLRVDVSSGTDSVIDSMIDVRTETNTKDTRTDTKTNTRTESDSTNTNGTDRDHDRAVDVQIDATTDADVDTGVIDVDVQTDTSVRSGLSL